MIQSIYTSCYLILSDLVAITGVLSQKNFLEIIRVGAVFIDCNLMKKSLRRFSFVSNFKKLTFTRLLSLNFSSKFESL